MKSLFYLAVALLLSIFPASASVTIPSGFSLSPSDTSITVTWSKNTDSETTGYYIYYGTASSALDTRIQVSGIQRESRVIEDLTEKTTYYVAMSAFGPSQESGRTTTLLTTTTASATTPSTPEGFRVSSLSEIAENQIPLSWNLLDQDFVSTYKIYYSLTSGDYSSGEYKTAGSDISSLMVSGLSENTRYFFRISAVSTSGEESAYSTEIAADTLPDTLPPPPPIVQSAVLSGPGTVTVTLGNPLEGLADFSVYTLKYGTEPGVYTESMNPGSNPVTTISGLESETTYYFTATAMDISGNISENADEKTVTLEPYVSLLHTNEEMEGGCLIQSAWNGEFRLRCGALLLLCIVFIPPLLSRLKKKAVMFIVAGIVGHFPLLPQVANAQDQVDFSLKGNNTAGIKYGIFLPEDRMFKDIYDPSTGPVSIFYERRLSGGFFVSIETGYLFRSGHARTVSGARTDIKTEISIIPAAAGILYEYPLYSFVHLFGGAGLDYWHVEESLESVSGLPDIEEWISGYHAAIGIRLFTEDPSYPGIGIQAETGYSQIDCFGRNSTNLGGFSATIGVCYRF